MTPNNEDDAVLINKTEFLEDELVTVKELTILTRYLSFLEESYRCSSILDIRALF